MCPFFDAKSPWFDFLREELNIDLQVEEFQEACSQIDDCVQCCGKCLSLSYGVSICSLIAKKYAHRHSKPPTLLDDIRKKMNDLDSNPPTNK